MKSFNTLLLALALAQSAGLSAAEGDSWLQLTESESGFLFEGVETNGKFSFDVPGTSIQTAQDGDKALAKIDEVLVQVFRAEPPEDSDGSSLAKYAAAEAQYFESAGGKVSESTLCKSMRAEHQEWRAVLPNGAASIFFATRLGSRLLVVVVASDGALSERASGIMSAICGTFKA